MVPFDKAQIPELSLSTSEKRLLGLLFKTGPRTQADIAQSLGLTQQSASRLTKGMLERGLLEEGEKLSTGRRGYPSTTIQLNSEYCHSFGVGILGDRLSVCVCDFKGNTVEERFTRMSTMAVARVFDWFDSQIEELSQSHCQNGEVAGIGVGIAASFIGEDKGFNTPFYLDEWAGVDIERIFTDRYGLPAIADNNANLAALAEAMNGVGRWADSFTYLYISAGVGGGVVLNGEVWRGRHGNAGEVAGGLPSNIYPFPNLELLRKIVVRDGAEFETVTELIENYDPSWPAIDEWLGRVRDSFSIIASNATAILDLDAIVFGGQMPVDLAERVIKVVDLYDQKRRMIPRPTARLVPSETSGEPVALGAAILPLNQAFFVHPASFGRS